MTPCSLLFLLGLGTQQFQTILHISLFFSSPFSLLNCAKINKEKTGQVTPGIDQLINHISKAMLWTCDCSTAECIRAISQCVVCCFIKIDVKTAVDFMLMAH